MDALQVVITQKFGVILFVAGFCLISGINGYNTYTLHGSSSSFVAPNLVTFEHRDHHMRTRRDVPAEPAAAASPPAGAAAPANGSVVPASPPPVMPPASKIEDSNRTVPATATNSSSTALAAVTQIPLLGRNGTGIRQNVTTDQQKPTQTKVSEPIYPDDSIPEMFNETQIEQEHSKQLKIENHEFYNSTFIANKTYFDEYWQNITSAPPEVHPVLSHSHRRATTLSLSFDFPFYGHPIRNITVATGGFIYTGEHVHNWLAATQYIAPLMANFDTRMSNDSWVKLYNDDERFTAFWENVTVQEDPSKRFTFAVTLRKNGDIDFAYKDIPIPVTSINDTDHPVKVGISDAYLNDRIFFLVRRKTIYEYHRVSLKTNYNIASGTILRLSALPTCLQYEACDACVNHNTGFNCMWCGSIQKCSSGTDRNKQDWLVRNCDQQSNHVTNSSQCPATPAAADTGNTAYVTDNANHTAGADVNTLSEKLDHGSQAAPAGHSASGLRTEAASASPVGGTVAAIAAVALVCCVAAWALYAFKNPHTRSGQFLIKYRPTQWRWRRGVARYTAATIHM